MKNKKYLKAAEGLVDNKYPFYVCGALCHAITGGDVFGTCPEEVYAFQRMFEPTEYREKYWFGDLTEENQLARSLALLFMYEMGV